MTNLFKALEASFQGDVTADASALVSVYRSTSKLPLTKSSGFL